MKTPLESGYVKRTQKDYSISFKLQVFQEIESGRLERTEACHKYGIQARSAIREHRSNIAVSKTPEQKILELEARVKLLQKQKARAEHLAERADKKAIIFDMLVDLAEKEYHIDIRKNYTPKLSTSIKNNTKKR